MSRRPGGRRRGDRGRRRSTGLLLTALLGVLVAVLLVVFAVRFANKPGGKLHGAFGGGPYDVGRASVLARPIAKAGPILLQDLLSHQRDLYVQHLGTDPAKGWSAFEAHAPGAPRRCQVRWDETQAVFRDPCDGRTYPADGAGLTAYPTTVDIRGHVTVDLRTAPR